MTNTPAAGKHPGLIFRLGLIVAVGVSIAFVGSRRFAPHILDSNWIQFAFAASFVAGLVCLVIGLRVAESISKEQLDLITLVLAISAMMFAILQFIDSRRQEEKMETLAREASTRFVGTFPKNLEPINELVRHADRRLDVMADYAGYGNYEEPEKVETYLRALEDLRLKPAQVRVLVYDYKKARACNNAQFKEDEVKMTLGKPDPTLSRFLGFFNIKKPETPQEFNALLLKRQKGFLDRLTQSGAHIRVTDRDLPYYSWIEDDQEAVVVFLNEVSFRTGDARLVVDTFKVRFCEAWNGADDFDTQSKDWHTEGRRSGHQCAVRE